jgi:hypothetical protein
MVSTMQQGGESRASDLAMSKSTATATKTFRFRSLCEYAVDQGLENHGTSHMGRQTDVGEQEIRSPSFRLATPCVSAHREARYI